MHKSGNKVNVTLEEIFAMKEDGKLFSRFVALSRDWINAEAFKFSRRTRASLSEAQTWLTSGLWDGIQRADDRTEGVGIVFNLARFYANRSYVAQYVNCSQKTEDACDSCKQGEEGEMEEIHIPDFDEGHTSLNYRDFMGKLQKEVTERDFLIIQKKLEGYTLREIGESLGKSKQAIAQRWEKNILPKLRAFA